MIGQKKHNERIKKGKESKIRKKWPFIVLISVVSVWALNLAFFITIWSIEDSVQENEKHELLSDFGPFLDDYFCAYYSSESDKIYYKNNAIDGHNSTLFHGRVFALSNNCILSVLQKNNRNTRDAKTEIYSMDWNCLNENLITSLDGRYDWCELSDGTFMFTNQFDDNDSFVFDFVSGKADKADSSFNKTKRSETIGKISFLEGYDYYSVELPFENKKILRIDNIDSTIVSLMQKWSFKPNFCQRMIDGSICCAFYKSNKHFGNGQTAVLLMNMNDSFNEISYQIVLPSGVHQSEDRIFDIRISFSKEISFE